MIIDLSILFVYDDELRYAIKNAGKRSLAFVVESYSIHSLANVSKRELRVIGLDRSVTT